MIILRSRRWAPAAVLALLAAAPPLFAQACSIPAGALPGTIPGMMYQWRILSMTGQTPINANSPLTYLSPPSIADNGAVAFVADFNSGGEGIVATIPTEVDPTLAQTVVSFADPTSGRTYGTNTQIDDLDQVLSSDDISGIYTGRLWLAYQPGAFTPLLNGGPGQSYSAILSNGSVNNNGDAVVLALSNAGATELVSVKDGAVAGKLQLPAGSTAYPQIADTGDILVVYGGSATSPIEVYNQSLKTVEAIVANISNFSAIGTQPGMSSDGNVVAFYGEPNAAGALLSCGVPSVACGPNPGIFASVKTGSTWTLVRVTGSNGELGYDDNGNPLAFSLSGYLPNTRIAVANLALTGCPLPTTQTCGSGSTPVESNSFVVSFIGTPTAASKINPWITGFPLLFSANQGLWTIRVDVEYELSSPSVQVIHPATAIKVVQIGDTIGGNVISAINVFDQLANAAQDDSGTIRTMRRGDHRVAFQAITSTGADIIVRGDHLDSDQDGLLDHWETTGIDMNQDGVVDLDLAAMGANPCARDLFLEIDWLDDLSGTNGMFQPFTGLINAAPGQPGFSPLVTMFNNAPALSGKLYGLVSNGTDPADIPAGIALHIDGGTGFDKGTPPGAFSYNMQLGPLDGGDLISANGKLAEVLYFGNPNTPTTADTAPGVTSLAFQSAKAANFGSQDNDGRELAFHYVIIGDYIGFDLDKTNANTWTVAGAANATATTGPTLTSVSKLPAGSGTQPLIRDVVKITGGPQAEVNQYASIVSVDTATQTLTLSSNWANVPTPGDTFVILAGNMGRAEVSIAPGPDYNSLPGNDLMMVEGAAGQAGWMLNGVLGSLCYEWRTLAHELGHTMGLRHGGNNASTPGPGAPAYLSLMSYTWQNACAGTVQSYSIDTDATFDDWANLRGDFPDVQNFLGNTLGIALGDVPESTEQSPELTVQDYISQNGPPNYTPPAVKVQTPAANANVGLTLPLTVVVDATDSAGVSSVTVSFDVTGTGALDTVAGKLSGATYKASFPALSGPTGARTITASAIDYLGNYATAKESVNVIEPYPVPSLISLVPPNATHGGKTFTLTVNGSKFVSGCTVEWNGKSVSTSFVNSGQVTGKITAADIATAGKASVTVKNPAPGGGTSNPLTFTIN
jgi:Big-like domain-containing protein